MHFVLVHGAGHGAWCWYKIATILQAAGHEVTCVELKSAGIDPTDPNAVSSFDEYDQPLHDFLANLPANEKVALVGHSQGGANVTNAIFTFPEKIHVAIYLAGLMMRDVYGKSHDEVDAKIKNAYWFGDKFDFHFSAGSIIPTSIRVKPELRRQFLYNMSPEKDYVLATTLLKWSPVRVAKYFHGEENVPRVYIKTLKDNMESQAAQDLLIALWPPSQVYEIESDHSAFFSAPDKLSELLVEAVNSVNA